MSAWRGHAALQEIKTSIDVSQYIIIPKGALTRLCRGLYFDGIAKALKRLSQIVNLVLNKFVDLQFRQRQTIALRLFRQCAQRLNAQSEPVHFLSETTAGSTGVLTPP